MYAARSLSPIVVVRSYFFVGWLLADGGTPKWTAGRQGLRYVRLRERRCRLVFSPSQERLPISRRLSSLQRRSRAAHGDGGHVVRPNELGVLIGLDDVLHGSVFLHSWCWVGPPRA